MVQRNMMNTPFQLLSVYEAMDRLFSRLYSEDRVLDDESIEAIRNGVLDVIFEERSEENEWDPMYR